MIQWYSGTKENFLSGVKTNKDVFLMSKVIKLNRNVNLTWEEIFNQFILLKQAQELSETTINDYKYGYTRFDGHGGAVLSPNIIAWLRKNRRS